MNHFLFFFLFASLSQVNSAPLDNTTGRSLYQSCLAYVRMADGTTKDLRQDTFEAHYCSGYVGGYASGVNNASDYLKRKMVCFEKTTTTDTLIRVYVAFMQKNPEHMDEDKDIGLTFALTTTYHCPYK